MKHLKFTKTNLTQLPHPTGKTPDRIFAQNCSGLCVRIQPQPSLVKSYYASFSKYSIHPDGKQKRSGRYNFYRTLKHPPKIQSSLKNIGNYLTL